MKSLGEAVLLLGCMYFGFTYGFSWWIQGLMILCTITWAMYTIPDENKRLLVKQADYYNAKAVYYYSKEKEIDKNNDRKR